MFLFSGGQTWVSAHVSVLFCHAVIEPQNRRHWWYFCFLIINAWVAFLLPQQIKEDWVRRRGPDQLSRQPFSLSSPSDTPQKSGHYQRLKKAVLFYFTVNFHYSLFPQLLTLYSIWHYPFHLSIFFCPLTKIHTTTLFQFVMPYPNCIVDSHPPTLILFFSTCDFLFWQKPPCKNSSWDTVSEIHSAVSENKAGFPNPVFSDETFFPKQNKTTKINDYSACLKIHSLLWFLIKLQMWVLQHQH